MTSFVYFIQRGEGGPIKIGVSRNPQTRLSALQTASDAPLRLIAAMGGDKRTERELHLRFAHARLHGEWFSPADEICEYVRSVLAPASESAEPLDDETPPSFDVFAARLAERFNGDAAAFCSYLEQNLPASAFDKVMALTGKAMLMGGA